MGQVVERASRRFVGLASGLSVKIGRHSTCRTLSLTLSHTLSMLGGFRGTSNRERQSERQRSQYAKRSKLQRQAFSLPGRGNYSPA